MCSVGGGDLLANVPRQLMFMYSVCGIFKRPMHWETPRPKDKMSEHAM